MGTSEVFSFFLMITLLNISVMANTCSISSNYLCWPFELVPRFPFRIKDQQPDSCGYPGFSLTCKTNLIGPFSGKVLELPHSGEFLVEQINYVKQEIVLQDPNNCLPKRILELNLSDSPFKSVHYQNYTFIICPRQKIPYGSILSKYILFCLGVENGYVLATSSMILVGDYCKDIKTVPVPVPIGYGLFLSDSYRSSITLSWDEVMNQIAGFVKNGIWDADCGITAAMKQDAFGKKRLTAGAISGISIGIGLPVLLGIIYCIAFCIRVCSEDDVYQPSNVEFSNATSPVQPVISHNDSTIDSYPKIVLGESRRLPNPDDNICPICLSEYLPKEILKIIPECNHNFHADCIDQWLHTNMTCPVCRNSPT